MAMGTLLAAEVPTDIQRHVSLAPYTTTRVGGAADWFATVRSSRAVVSALGWAADRDLPVAVIGKGSNLLVDDDGFRGLVLRLAGALSGISLRDGGIWCGGGASFPRAVQRAAASGWGGIEFGASIPGTAGGAVAMNAGAYGTEVVDVLEWAVVCSAEGHDVRGADDFDFAYRHSNLRPGEIVTLASFRLHADDAEVVAGRLREWRTHRRDTQPQGVRTFGSVFTNPPRNGAGRLLEAAGCKGLRVGGARFSPKHANFIEVDAESRTADVVALMAEGRRRVRAAGGPVLHPEVHYLHPTRGMIPTPLPELS